jgi:hypothetical protein
MCNGLMTFDDKAKRFLKTQLILAVIPIPIPITQLFAFYRIRKLTYGMILEVIISFVDFLILSFSWPFGMMITLPISVLIPVYYIRKWTLEFNETKSMF